jgi:transcriptional regulator with XRE-family HTH domain
MSAKEIKQRKGFFKEFGAILVRRHGQNYYSSYYNQSRVTTDEAATRFGRYIRAARANQGLSVAALASQTRLSEATLTALEQGIILSCDIKTKWLKDLAKALGENEEDFCFLLGREISYSHRWSWLNDWLLRLQGQQFPLCYFFNPKKVISLKIFLQPKPVYAVYSALLFCCLIGGFVLFSPPPFSDPLPSPTKANSFVKVEPQTQFNPVRTEFDFETKTTVLPIAFVGRKVCCIY